MQRRRLFAFLESAPILRTCGTGRVPAGTNKGKDQLNTPQHDGRKHSAQQHQFAGFAVPEHLGHEPCRSQEQQG